MSNTKTVVVGALLAVIAALFQVIPVFLSELFVILTILSAVPIYIVSRLSPKIGLLSYFTASMLIMLISTHEGIFFLCTNGIIGISLGICSYYTKKKTITWLISSVILTITLSIMNYGIGIPVFGTNIPGGIIIQLAILFIFSVVYNIFYYNFSSLIFKLIKKLKIY
ncbi:hypothetical protein [Candidatus Clostridium radicumherbarum]|uniref:DUF2232 domain-containing protein n=1 Tax=Candidatus Clostridium radicumherbarum TaxID=3381662 RepID=A0ABW8TMH3_9CLOT